jgi:hypothetical protein
MRNQLRRINKVVIPSEAMDLTNTHIRAMQTKGVINQLD